jgi:hypothetical protein
MGRKSTRSGRSRTLPEAEAERDLQKKIRKKDHLNLETPAGGSGGRCAAYFGAAKKRLLFDKS